MYLTITALCSVSFSSCRCITWWYFPIETTNCCIFLPHPVYWCTKTIFPLSCLVFFIIITLHLLCNSFFCSKLPVAILIYWHRSTCLNTGFCWESSATLPPSKEGTDSLVGHVLLDGDVWVAPFKQRCSGRHQLSQRAQLLGFLFWGFEHLNNEHINWNVPGFSMKLKFLQRVKMMHEKNRFGRLFMWILCINLIMKMRQWENLCALFLIYKPWVKDMHSMLSFIWTQGQELIKAIQYTIKLK